ncbi:MAG TPA: nucleotidyltransferase domain-containing protein [Candidatus Binatia bacterium]|nr:nucleotidyltransferase domain-containing protein [Candidatus Binatia bacterium]
MAADETEKKHDPAHSHELWALRERAKELKCIYRIASALSRRQEPPPLVFRWVLEAIPPAWQYPEDTTARIEYFGRTHALPDFVDTPWRLRSPISIWRTTVGAIEVHYKHAKDVAWEGPFLQEERELLDNIAHRIGEYLEWKQRELSGERLGSEPEHWRWRYRFAERLAGTMDPVRFGVQAAYLFGSTEAGTAGAGSDIDLIVVCDGNPDRLKELYAWLEGWSLCLAEVSFQLYGFPSQGLLDVKFLNTEEAQLEIPSMISAGKTLQPLPVGAALHAPPPSESA